MARKSHEQIFVSSFRGLPPEVHLISVDSDGMLSVCETSVGDGDEVVYGRVQKLELQEVRSVVCGDRILSALGADGQVLLQLFFENMEDERLWAGLLRAGAGLEEGDKAAEDADDESGRGSQRRDAPAEAEDDDESEALQARSRQLQEEVQNLEGVSQRRDRQIEKMMTRLDGAMQMLAAIQGMCQQQRQVIQAQQVAIEDLRTDLGISDPEERDSDMEVPATRSPSPDEAEIAAKTKKMMELQKQVEGMQSLLEQLESQADGDELLESLGGMSALMAGLGLGGPPTGGS